MAEFTPTRSLAIALAEERRTMREGYAFLDEKCLLLAGQMLREVKRHRALVEQAAPLQAMAERALAAALLRHGLNGLQVYPAAPGEQRLRVGRRALLGVEMRDALLEGAPGEPPAAVAASPEAAACTAAFAAWAARLAELAAVSGNLARLHAEYRKTVRRVRALQDVLLPEVEQTLHEVDASLEELEQDEAGFLRRAARAVAG
ncbi:MAG: ATPase [Burkholderiales bacterium]|nr:ATPase [Burkholderiales bacterium]